MSWNTDHLCITASSSLSSWTIITLQWSERCSTLCPLLKAINMIMAPHWVSYSKGFHAPAITALEGMVIEQDNIMVSKHVLCWSSIVTPVSTVINWTKFHFFSTGSTALPTCEATPPTTSKTQLCSDHYCLRMNVLWSAYQILLQKFWRGTKVLASFPGSSQKRRRRAWYRFACDIVAWRRCTIK